MPVDLFGSVRTTALIALVSASFASPIVVKSDALASVGDRLRDRGAEQEVVEELVAGGYAYEMPATWGKLGVGVTSESRGTRGTTNAGGGAVVSALCPGGSTGAACKDGVKVTFITYRGGEEGLPMLTSLEEQLDARFRTEFSTFRKGSAKLQPSVDGTRWLRYEFTHQSGKVRQQQIIAAYRHGDGSSVIAVAAGSASAVSEHREELDTFLASGHELVAAAEH